MSFRSRWCVMRDGWESSFLPISLCRVCSTPLDAQPGTAFRMERNVNQRSSTPGSRRRIVRVFRH